MLSPARRSRRRRLLSLLGALLILGGLLPFAAAAPVLAVPSADIVISEVYGGGGNAGATRSHDYIELYNQGATPVSLGGNSVQYASATGTGLFGGDTGLRTDLPDVTLNPGQHFLIQEASQAAVGAPLPTPDVVDPTPIAMAAGAGKVVYVTGTAALGCNGGATPCSAAQLARIVDLVGYGNANFFEGAGAAPTLSATTSASRNAVGADTDNNNTDFTAGAPDPDNSGGGGDTAPSVSTTSPANTATNVALGANISITFSEAVNVTGTWFTINCATSLGHTAVASGGPTTFTLNPDADFVNSESCTVTIFAAQVADQDAVDPPDNMASDHVFSFTTEAALPTTPIHDIQAATHTSPFNAQTVVTTGIVTAKSGNGFWIQDPAPDADTATSEGIFVFTNSAPLVAVGDSGPRERNGLRVPAGRLGQRKPDDHGDRQPVHHRPVLGQRRARADGRRHRR